MSLLTACGDEAAEPDVPAACRDAVPKNLVDVPAEALAPPGVELLVGRVQRDAAVVASGFIAMLPSTFQQRAMSAGFEVIWSESEADESETIYTDGDRRVFWKVVDACPGGSSFVVQSLPAE